MAKQLSLKRPLVFFDLETTGTNAFTDRIVEISVLKINTDGTTQKPATTRVNPGCHIPKEASDVHHITDADVANERTFKELASRLAKYFEGCDIAGFNSNRFDIPMLQAEFKRAGIEFDLTNRKFIDVLSIYHKREPRNLSAAYRFYCGKELEGAHGAEADIMATYEVLLGQLQTYPDLPNDIDSLAAYTFGLPEGCSTVDSSGKLYRNKSGEICFNFSKFKGQSLLKVFSENPGMKDWCLTPSRGLPSDVVEIIKKF